jgi:chemotaxis protein CheY-P-specific phosphatase CheC
MEPPKGRRVTVGELPQALFPGHVRVAGVFVDLSGPVEGVAGLLLPEANVDALLALLAEDLSGDLENPRARSAFAEIGNIALCAAAGAIAKLTDGIVLPSVPRVGVDSVDGLLARSLDPSLRDLPAYLVETELSVRELPVHLRFVWVPLP